MTPQHENKREASWFAFCSLPCGGAITREQGSVTARAVYVTRRISMPGMLLPSLGLEREYTSKLYRYLVRRLQHRSDILSSSSCQDRRRARTAMQGAVSRAQHARVLHIKLQQYFHSSTSSTTSVRADAS